VPTTATSLATRFLPELGVEPAPRAAGEGRRTRYPGPRPFEDGPLDRELYFGRQQCGQELLHQALSSRLLLMFGKSGTGKTSLLRALLVPGLRRRDLLPIYIRLNCPSEDLVESVLAQVEAACEVPGVDLTPGDHSHLWLYFKTAVFSRGDALVRPVLIFDQFEEAFTRQQAPARERLAAQLGELLGDGLPAALREQFAGKERPPCSLRPPAVKVILSLREDYLGQLQALTDCIPGLFQSRFRLTPLDREAARAAIVEPARLSSSSQLASEPFELEPAAVEQTLDFLASSEGEIEPFQLQLLCQRVEAEVLKRQQAGRQEVRVGSELLGGRAGMERILEGFYLDVIRGFPATRRARVRRLCEEGLLTREGVRRVVEQSSIAESYQLTAAELERLVDSRLLRKEQRREVCYFEISHDALAKPILQSRPPIRSWKHTLIEVAILAGVAAVAVGWFWSEAEDAKAEAKQQRTRSDVLVSSLASVHQQAHEQQQRARNFGDGLAEIYQRVVDERSERLVFADRLASGGRGPQMLPVAAGEFSMGSAESQRARPVRLVSVAQAFAIGRYEVTRGEFGAFVAATGHVTTAERGAGCKLHDPRDQDAPKTDASWRNPGLVQAERHPVVCVSWDDARAYAGWLSQQTGHRYRLPTEAEWEYAARAGTVTTYWWGNELRDDRANCGDCAGATAGAGTSPVGSFLPNPFGLSDTAGNAAEWIADCWHDNFEGAPLDASVAWVPANRAGCDERVTRGGTWYGVGTWTRSDGRWHRPATGASDSQGFRLVRESPLPLSAEG